MTDIISKRKRNNRPARGGYEPDGTPADALCKPGQYADMTKGKMYRMVQGATRWSNGRKERDDY